MPATLITIHPLDDPENPPNAAEQKVADALMNLGDGFVIRWGFYHANKNGSIQGEGDFLVLGPDGNVLHIERLGWIGMISRMFWCVDPLNATGRAVGEGPAGRAVAGSQRPCKDGWQARAGGSRRLQIGCAEMGCPG